MIDVWKYIIVGTIFQKLIHLGWIQNFLLERGDKPEKGWGVGVDVEMGGGGVPLLHYFTV